VWFAVSVAFALFAAACLVMWFAVAPFQRPRTAYLAAGLGVVAVLLALRRAPEPNTPMTHVVIALTYLGTSAAMFMLSPESIAAAPAALFVGPLAALWLDDLRHVFAHYAAASVALLAPSILGLADANTLAATATMLAPIFVLGMCCRTVLNAAERQSEALEGLAMRDPLTGVGNRRLLQTQGNAELARHAAGRRELAVFALDLDGFKTINDEIGHAAGDDLLVYVAQRLHEAAGPHAIVVRQGGDEFTILVPDTPASEADAVAERLQHALRPAVRAGIGAASFPTDANELDRLVEIADARLVGAKERRRSGATPIDLEAVRAAARDAQQPMSVDEAAATAVDAGTITRAELSSAPWLWRTTGAMFLYYAVVGALVLMIAPQLSGPWFGPLVASGALVGIWILATGTRSRSGGVQSHVVVALSYIYPFLAVLACRPGGAIAVGSAVFAGALIATRVTTRRDAVLHTAASAGLMASAALLGTLDPASMLAMLMLIVATIVMSACCVIVLEAAEAQGRELERIAVVDPLTGLANRRRLHAALAEHLDRGEPLAVLALDLNGFKALNDAAGHGAGDELLVDVADQLRRIAGPSAVVARPGGDEFTILVPAATPAGVGALANELRAAIGRLSRFGHRIGTGIGVAFAPADATGGTALLEAADRRLLIDKYGSPAAASAVA
jgi:diguanylate cyclase (GGDEF)-like protein